MLKKNFESISLCIMVMLSSVAHGIDQEGAADFPIKSASNGNSIGLRRATSGAGSLGFIEYNPADLLQNRIRIDGEYLLLDGFSLGAEVEYQSKKSNEWSQNTVSAGISTTQYFLNSTLNGPYLKGQLAAFGTDYQLPVLSTNPKLKGKFVDRKGSVLGASAGTDLGYRFQILDYFTACAAYGVRRISPDFFNVSDPQAVGDYKGNMPLWDFRVQLSLGINI